MDYRRWLGEMIAYCELYNSEKKTQIIYFIILFKKINAFPLDPNESSDADSDGIADGDE